jgi:hypothetical protein
MAITTPRILTLISVNVRQRHGLQRAAARDPGVVDQNIQPAEDRAAWVTAS